MPEFRMPSLGAGMDAGKLLEWYVAPGDEVHRGDIVALVETDKAAIEVEIFENGVVEQLLIEEGVKVPVGTLLAALAPLGTQVPSAAPAESADAEPPPVPAVPTAAGTPSRPRHVVVSPLVRRLARDRGLDPDLIPATGSGGVVTRADVEHAAGGNGAARRASPYARRLAAERGTELATVRGSGPGGAVVVADLEDAGPVPAEAAPVTPNAPAGPADRQAAMRQAIARAMARSNREIPHYYLGTWVDMEASLAWLAARNADRPPAGRILPAALVLRAVATALGEHPEFNGLWEDDAFRPGDGIHLGVAISLRGGGLIAPAIRDADRLGLDELMAALKDLVARARAGRIRGSELTDPTITVTNLGDQGVEIVHGVIYPPQVALVGAGRIVERPWAEDGMVGVRRVIHLSLAADHRASDGHRGGLFLTRIADRLRRVDEEEPDG